MKKYSLIKVGNKLRIFSKSSKGKNPPIIIEDFYVIRTLTVKKKYINPNEDCFIYILNKKSDSEVEESRVVWIEPDGWYMPKRRVINIYKI